MEKSYKQKGFTLIELLVVIAIIGMLSSIVLASLNTARAKARDARRLSDLTQIRTALNLYYADNGRYPPAYPAAWSGVSASGCGWGNNGTVSGATAYITGLAPTYIPVLPQDPSSTAACTGYIYNTNGSGSDYMFLVYNTVEGSSPTSLRRPVESGNDHIYAIWSSTVGNGEVP